MGLDPPTSFRRISCRNDIFTNLKVILYVIALYRIDLPIYLFLMFYVLTFSLWNTGWLSFSFENVCESLSPILNISSWFSTFEFFNSWICRRYLHEFIAFLDKYLWCEVYLKLQYLGEGKERFIISKFCF